MNIKYTSTTHGRVGDYHWSSQIFTPRNSTESFRKNSPMVVRCIVAKDLVGDVSDYMYVLSEGESVCSKKDKPDAKLGVNIALGRAIKKLRKENL